MRIILLGPPGAGKGTQAKALSKRLNLAHISTGDLLRENVSSGSQLGKKAKGFMNQGALVPDDLVTQMLLERIDQFDLENGFILDGYPRTLNQAEILDEALKKRKTQLDLVVYLDASEKTIIQRLSGRLVCGKCQANFHLQNMPPKVNLVCDNCGAKLYQRSDDKEETVKKRLEVYKKESLPLIQYYEKTKKLERVLADGQANAVLEKIIHLIKEKNGSLKI